MAKRRTVSASLGLKEPRTKEEQAAFRGDLPVKVAQPTEVDESLSFEQVVTDPERKKLVREGVRKLKTGEETAELAGSEIRAKAALEEVPETEIKDIPTEEVETLAAETEGARLDRLLGEEEVPTGIQEEADIERLDRIEARGVLEKEVTEGRAELEAQRIARGEAEKSGDESFIERDLERRGIEQPTFFGALGAGLKEAFVGDRFGKSFEFGKEVAEESRELAKEGDIGALEMIAENIAGFGGGTIGEAVNLVGTTALSVVDGLTPEFVDKAITKHGKEAIDAVLDEKETATGKSIREHLGEFNEWFEGQDKKTQVRFKSAALAAEVLGVAKPLKITGKAAIDEVRAIDFTKFKGSKEVADIITEEKPTDITKLAQKAEIGEASARQVAGKPELFNEYKEQLDKATKDASELSPSGYAVEKFGDDVIEPMKTKKDELGKMVGEAKARVKDQVITKEEIELFDDSLNGLLNKIGIKRSIDPETGKPVATVTKKGVKSQEEAALFQPIIDRVERFKENPTMENLETLMNKFNEEISIAKNPISGTTKPLEGIQSIGIDINKNARKIRKARQTDEEAQAFEQFGILAEMFDEGKTAGFLSPDAAKLTDLFTKDPQIAFKRLFSEKDEATKRVLKNIDKKLGTDMLGFILDNQAMASIVTKTFGTRDMLSVLQKDVGLGITPREIGWGVITGGKTVPASLALKAVKFFSRPQPEKDLAKIISGKRFTDLERNIEAFKDMPIDSIKFGQERGKALDELLSFKKQIEAERKRIKDKAKKDRLETYLKEVQKGIDDLSIPSLPESTKK